MQKCWPFRYENALSVGVITLARAVLVCSLSVSCGSCAAGERVVASGVSAPKEKTLVEVTPDLVVRELASGVWVHTSFKDLPGSPHFPSNGLILVSAHQATLVDSAWTEPTTKALLEWVRTHLGVEVRDAIYTHAHDDRMGGDAVLRSAGVSTWALPQTRERALPQGWSAPSHELKELQRLDLDGLAIEVRFPGAAHAPDNLVVWLAQSQVLFGSCMVRSGDAPSLGNLADANVSSWKRAIQDVIERYRHARWVVPGHGKTGGPELLEHTRELVEASLTQEK